MKKLRDTIELVSGSPQFRIKGTLDNSAPTYIYYGQPEIDADLVGFETSGDENKKIKTFDKVNTVNQGDILFSLISGKATLVREEHQGYLYTQNYVKLTPKNKIEVKYLIYLLNEDEDIRRQFQTGLQGSMVLKYTIKQLRELELPQLPSLEKQKLLGEIYFHQLRLQALKERVAIAETTIILEKLKEVKDQ